MIKIFNHYLSRRTLLQVFLDLGLVAATVILSLMWQVRDFTSGLSLAITCSLLLAVGMLAINSGLGFYQRVHTRSVGQSRSRGVL